MTYKIRRLAAESFTRDRTYRDVEPSEYELPDDLYPIIQGWLERDGVRRPRTIRGRKLA